MKFRAAFFFLNSGLDVKKPDHLGGLSRFDIENRKIAGFKNLMQATSGAAFG
jgi:hypothetical protein